MAERKHVEDPEPGAGYERRDTNTGSIFKFGAGLLGLILAVLGLMWGLLKLFQTSPPEITTQPSAMAERNVLPPEPRLQAAPRLDMLRFRLWEDSLLSTYGWVDQGAGLVRVPLDTAIVLMVRRGFPLDDEAVREVRAGSGAAAGSPQEGTSGSGQISGTTR